MTCQSCSHENANSAKFCEECGKPLVRQCPGCGNDVAPAAKFCPTCGHRLVAPGSVLPPPGAAEIQPTHAPPPPVASPAPSPRAESPPAIEGERKLVTLLFTDIVGSTALAEKLDPEEWGEIVSGAHRFVSEAVYRQDGTIAQLLGDGVLAFFGAPTMHEDDPVRAVSAGLAIIASVEAYALELQARRGIDSFRMRVGLNTGRVVVGNIGGEGHVEYLAVGDSVNLAARMQAAAEPNTVLISNDTARLVRFAFDLEPRGPFDLKGKSEPVPAFRVRARKLVAEPSRGIAGLSSPMVGRERELSILENYIHELRQGQGHIISLMAEAGLGKSRLAAEIHRWVDVATSPESASPSSIQSIIWLEGRSQSHETTTPYGPIADLLRHWAGLVSDAQLTGGNTYAALLARVSDVTPERSEIITPFLATLLGIPLMGDALDRVHYVEPPNVRRLTFQAVKELIQAIATIRPVVLAFEDLHWVDATSLALIEELLPLVTFAPILILAIFRPQPQEPSWHFHETATQTHGQHYLPITLEPLDPLHSRQLVANLLHVEDLPERVRSLILARSEGNPFYVEEMIRSLLDANLVVRDGDHWRATREIESIAVPDTLSGVIGARLDRLGLDSKRTIQFAAVVGREFGHDVLVDISQGERELDPALDDLQRRELIREAGRQIDLTYRFKHALTQETAYGSLLLRRRRDVHQRVARCLERTDRTRVYDIARHFLEAREGALALPYLVEAGERSAKAYATTEAIGYFTKAIELVKESGNAALAQRAYEGLGQAYALTGQGPRALDIFHDMVHVGEALGDVPMQISGLNKLSNTLLWSGQFAEIEHHLGDAERLARQHQDVPGLAEMFIIRCSVCMMVADFSSAVEHLGESVQIGRDLHIDGLTVFGLTHSANMFGYMGRFDDMWEAAQQALVAAQSLGELRFEADLHSFTYPMHYLVQGNLAEALRSTDQAITLGERINYSFAEAVAGYTAGLVHSLLGDYDRAIVSFRHSVAAARLLGFPFMTVFGTAALGTVYRELGDSHATLVDDYRRETIQMLDQPTGMSAGGVGWVDLGFGALAAGDVEQADIYFRNGLSIPTMHGTLNRPLFLMGSAVVALARGNPILAAEAIIDARQVAHDSGMTFLYPDIDLVNGRIQAALGNATSALACFTMAETAARSLGLRPTIWQSQAAAAQLLNSLGRSVEAETKRTAACLAIEAIASLFIDEDRRRAYRETALARVG